MLATQTEVVQAFSEVLNKPVTYNQVSRETARDTMMRSSLPQWAVDGSLDLMDLINSGDPSVCVPDEANDSAEVRPLPLFTACEVLHTLRDLLPP